MIFVFYCWIFGNRRLCFLLHLVCIMLFFSDIKVGLFLSRVHPYYIYSEHHPIKHDSNVSDNWITGSSSKQASKIFDCHIYWIWSRGRRSHLLCFILLSRLAHYYCQRYRHSIRLQCQFLHTVGSLWFFVIDLFYFFYFS